MAEYMSMDEARKALGIDEDTLLNLVQDNRLKGYRIDREMRFKEEDVKALAAAGLAATAPDGDMDLELIDDAPPPPPAKSEEIIFEDDEAPATPTSSNVPPTQEATVVEDAVEIPTEAIDDFEPEETDRDRRAKDYKPSQHGLRRAAAEEDNLLPAAPPIFNIMLVAALVIVVPLALVMFNTVFYGITTSDSFDVGSVDTTGMAPAPTNTVAPIFQTGMFQSFKDWVVGDEVFSTPDNFNSGDNETWGRPSINTASATLPVAAPAASAPTAPAIPATPAAGGAPTP